MQTFVDDNVGDRRSLRRTGTVHGSAQGSLLVACETLPVHSGGNDSHKDIAMHCTNPCAGDHQEPGRRSEICKILCNDRRMVFSSGDPSRDAWQGRYLEFAPSFGKELFRQGCSRRRAAIRPCTYAGLALLSLLLLQIYPAQADLQASHGTMLGESPRLPRLARRSAGHQGEAYLGDMGTLPSKHLDALRRASEDGNICGRDPLRTAPRTSHHDVVAGDRRPILGLKEGRPPLAICLDFDKTISQDHLYHLTRKSCNGLAGVDLPAAFGGNERIRSLQRFLDAAKSLGAAVHIISHNDKSDILQALHHVGLGVHFPSEMVMGWNELQEAQFTSKTQCATEIAKTYGLSQRRCLLVDDDQDNLEDAQGVMTYWVSSGQGLNEADMGCILNVVHAMRVAPERLRATEQAKINVPAVSVY